MGLEPSDESRISAVIGKVSDLVERKNRWLEEAHTIATISHSLQALRDLQIQTLEPVRTSGLLSLEFHPPLDIPAYAEGIRGQMVIRGFKML